MKNKSIIMIYIILFTLFTNTVVLAASIPTVDTLTFNVTRRINVTIEGEVLSDNGLPIVERGFLYSLTSNPIASGTKIIVPGELGRYYYKILNLNPSTKYYYAAYAINGAGIKYGPIKSFTTKRDTIDPEIIGSIVEPNNSYIDVYMSEYVFGNNRALLSLSNFRWTFLSNGGTATNATFSAVTRTDGNPLTGGEMVFRFWFNITGIPSGVETIEIWPYDVRSIFDASNRAMQSKQTTGPKTLNSKSLPQILSAFLSADNSYMDITMSKGVYSYGVLPLTTQQFSLGFIQNEGTATNAIITGVTNRFGAPLVGGEKVIRVLISVEGEASGDEFVSIKPKDGTSIYDSYGNPMSYSQTTGPKALNDLLSPAILGAVLADDNSFIDIDFNEGVYNYSVQPLSLSDFKVVFTQNEGNATAVSVLRLAKTDGTALMGGETSIRVYLNINGIPSGEETIEIQPSSGESVFDNQGNSLLETQTTGCIALNSRVPIKKLTHALKLPNDRNVGVVEKTFIQGDYVPMSIRLDILSALSNPTIVAGLLSSNANFCLKPILSATGSVDSSSVKVYKNGFKLSESIIEVEIIDNTLNIEVNNSFSSGDILEVVYFAKLSRTDSALKSKVRPTYGVGISFSCHVEWGYPINYYSIGNPGIEGLDQFEVDIIVANPKLLQ